MIRQNKLIPESSHNTKSANIAGIIELNVIVCWCEVQIAFMTAKYNQIRIKFMTIIIFLLCFFLIERVSA